MSPVGSGSKVLAGTRLSVAPTPIAAEDEADGRRRRSLDSRARIVAALLELIHSGDLAPSAEAVALRAGVGLRTVFRHFKDMESLYGEMAQAIEAELRTVVDAPFQSEPGLERLLELVQRRSAVFEKITPYKRASDIHRHQSAFLAASHARLVTLARDILRRELPADLVRDQLKFEALDMLLSYEVWSRLRRDQGLTARRARETLEAAVRAVIG